MKAQDLQNKILLSEMKEWLIAVYPESEDDFLKASAHEIKIDISNYYAGGQYQFYLDSPYYKLVVAESV